MFLSRLHVLNINITELYSDPFVVSYNKSNCLLVITKYRPQFTKVKAQVSKQSFERHELFYYKRHSERLCFN